MKLKLIACNVLYREVCHVVAHSKNKVDVEFLSKGLHDLESCDMQSRLQNAIDTTSKEDYDAILLGYALCNNGTANLIARTVPLVIPKAHDCITLFMGSREKYLNYFNDNPGTYFHTSGWIERNENPGDLQQLSIQNKTGMDKSFEELVAEYGEENAQFLYETLCDPVSEYGQLTYIDMGIGPNEIFEDFSRSEALKKNWKFEKIKGDLSLFEKLVDGEWSKEEFLVIQPGEKITPSYDDNIIKSDDE